MSNIKFEENFDLGKAPFGSKKITGNADRGLSSWLIKRGMAKDAKSAKTIMIVIIVFCFITAILIVGSQAGMNIFNGPKQKEDSFIEKIEQAPDFQKLSPQEKSDELNKIKQYYGN